MASIPMHSRDGRPWTASSEFEAFELESLGYTRDDGSTYVPLPGTSIAVDTTGGAVGALVAARHVTGGVADAFGLLLSPTIPELFDSFTTNPDGTPSTTDSGQPWTMTGASAPTVRSGALTFPAGAPTATAGYALAQCAATPRRVGCRFRFSATTGTGGSATLGAWANPSVIPGSAPLHLSITPTYARVSVWSSGVETVLTPLGQPNQLTPFAVPLKTDGVTEYVVDAVIDQASATAWILLPDGSTLTVRHPLIGSLAARWAFWEPLTQAAGDAVAAFTQVYAESRPGTVFTPHPAFLSSARAAEAAKPGAGPTTARPPSVASAGKGWADTTTGKHCYSDGTVWHDTVTGAVVGNLLAPNQANAVLDALGWVPQTNCARARETVIVPDGQTSAVRLTSSAAGLVQGYTGGTPTYAPVTAGAQYTAVLSVRASVGSRTVTPKISWFQANGTYISGSSGSAVGISSTGFTQALFTATAPALAANAVVGLDIATPAAAGEQFYIGKVALGAGTLAGYVEP